MLPSAAPGTADTGTSGSVAESSDTTIDATTSGDTSGSQTTDPDESGSSTTGGPGVCVERCEVDADCRYQGDDIGYSCIDNRCVEEVIPEPCKSDEQCVRELTGWELGPPCSTGSECADQPAMFCIEVGGEGHCVPGSAPDYNWCTFLKTDEIEVTDIDGETVTVCIVADAICGPDDVCFVPCQSDDDCGLDETAPRCNADTGKCECTVYSCEGLGAGRSFCLESGSCGCAIDLDCIEGSIGDYCLDDGRCGCRTVDVCPPYGEHDGTTVVCAAE